ncbi:MAG: WGxxGxxG family protein [Oscillatoria sp. PMC 1051.18]|nr:WGxxGxxG family protein [Oscillatoria sp. PMC 1050.18]MEC5029499.1 WGxxGxxG family protein [Oscillatoria sp. PMC 1051.18]
MKLSNLSKLAGASLLAASLAVFPAISPAQAQIDPEPEIYDDELYDEGFYDDDFDWGWLGLFGLIGLAGLAGRKKRKETVYNEPVVGDREVTTTNYPDYRR